MLYTKMKGKGKVRELLVLSELFVCSRLQQENVLPGNLVKILDYYCVCVRGSFVQDSPPSAVRYKPPPFVPM